MNCLESYRTEGIGRLLLTTAILLWIPFSVDAQIFSAEGPSYSRVFVDSDNFGPSYLETLETNYQKVDVDSIRLSMLNDLAYYTHTRDLNRSYALSLEGYREARRLKMNSWMSRFQITLGATLLRMEKLDSAQAVLEEARSYAKLADMPHLITQEGYVYERKGDLERAAEKAKEALEIGRGLNDMRAMAVAHSDLSNLYWKYENYDLGMEHGLKSLELFEARGLNDMDYDFTLYVVGNNLMSQERNEEALQYFQHAIAIGERYGFYNNLSDIYISMVDLQANMGLFDEAVKSGEEAVRYADLIGNDFLMMRSWLSIGKLQLLQGKYISAIESLNKSIEIATPTFGDKYYLSQAYGRLSQAYAGNHNYKDALEAFSIYDRLKNELYTEDANKRISDLTAEFEVAQKDTTILDQEKRLKKQRSSQTMITVIACLLLLLLVVLYVTYQNNKKKNLLLEKQNKEKDFLLKEIHHRVKNNLGIVSSLLDLQSAEMKDPKVIQAIHESQNRVYSMSMIHQKLYQGKNLSAIEMKDYFINLSEHILDSFGLKGKIDFSCEMEPLELDVDTAVPLGLIVNELITNSLKHAFPDDRPGEIVINMEKSPENQMRLRVSDNGIGMQKPTVEQEKNSGFGSKLIRLLVQQLDAKMVQKSDLGTSVQIDFKAA